jgi:hypothetical protein
MLSQRVDNVLRAPAVPVELGQALGVSGQ